MSCEIFDGDEEGYQQWIAANAFGIAINSSPGGLNPNYLKAHRPSCTSITRHAGAMTVYSKHCFDSVDALFQYVSDNSLPMPSFGCTTCKVSNLVPTSNPVELGNRANALIDLGFSSIPRGNVSPKSVPTKPATAIARDPAVVAWIKQNSEGKCELCRSDAPFCDTYGNPYLEVHHVITLSSGGPDTVDNTVALCPNCHRAMHFSEGKSQLLNEIYGLVNRLKRVGVGHGV